MWHSSLTAARGELENRVWFFKSSVNCCLNLGRPYGPAGFILAEMFPPGP